jgi:hypothetical protein
MTLPLQPPIKPMLAKGAKRIQRRTEGPQRPPIGVRPRSGLVA